LAEQPWLDDGNTELKPKLGVSSSLEKALKYLRSKFKPYPATK